MNKQHKRYTQSTPSHSLMLAVLLAYRQLPALVCTKLRSKAQGRTPVCFPVAMVNALATHTEPSAKLITHVITAHKAHHCDGHAPTQTRDYN